MWFLGVKPRFSCLWGKHWILEPPPQPGLWWFVIVAIRNSCRLKLWLTFMRFISCPYSSFSRLQQISTPHHAVFTPFISWTICSSLQNYCVAVSPSVRTRRLRRIPSSPNFYFCLPKMLFLSIRLSVSAAVIVSVCFFLSLGLSICLSLSCLFLFLWEVLPL